MTYEICDGRGEPLVAATSGASLLVDRARSRPVRQVAPSGRGRPAV